MKWLKVIKFVMSVPGLFDLIYDLVNASKDGKITRVEAKTLFNKLLVIVGVVVNK